MHEQNRFAVVLFLLLLGAFRFKFQIRFKGHYFIDFCCSVPKIGLYLFSRLCNISYGYYYEKKKVDTLPI